MKLNKIFIILIILIMMSTYFPMISRAEEAKIPIEITTIETPDFVKTNALKGKNIISWISNDEITMIATKSDEDAEVIYSNEYITRYSGLYSELYYTNNENLKELNKVDLKQYLINKGIDLNDSLIEIKGLYKNNNIFYIEIKIDYMFNDTEWTDYYLKYEKSKYMILEINNQMNINAVVLPNNSTELEFLRDEYEEEEIFSCVYNSNFILASQQFKGIYYITTDFKDWNTIELPEKTKSYFLKDVSTFEDGVDFIFEGYDEEYKIYSCATEDFVKHEVFTENYFSSHYDASIGWPFDFYNGYGYGVMDYSYDLYVLYKESCFDEYKEAHVFKTDDELFEGAENGFRYILMSNGSRDRIIFKISGINYVADEMKSSYIFNINGKDNTVDYYYLGLVKEYPFKYGLGSEDNIYFLNDTNELFILNNSNYSEMKKMNLSGNYNSISCIGDKMIILGDEDTLIFDVNDFKEKTTISGLNINDVKVENIKKQLLNILNVLEDQILKITNQEGKEIEIGQDVGTGTKVTVKNGDSEKEYTIVIYGDITGDGEINAVDALALIKGINNKVSFKSDAHKEAGRILVGEGEEPTALDALAIVKAANKKYTINQSK